MLSRPGLTMLHDFPEGESVVNMVLFQERLIVATDSHVYVLIDDALHPLEVVKLDEPKVVRS